MRVSLNPVCCQIVSVHGKLQQVCRVEVIHIGLLHKAIVLQQLLIAFVTVGMENLQ